MWRRTLSILLTASVIAVSVVTLGPARAEATTPPLFASISPGDTSCGLTSAGDAYCWGLNNTGGVGDGTYTNRWVPTPISGGFSWKKITSNGNVCAIRSNDAAYCWGTNSSGQLGIGSTSSEATTPQLVLGSISWKDIDVSTGVACGISLVGAGYCWGSNSLGQLGDGTATPQYTPHLIPGGYTWASIAPGYGYVCGVTTGNDLYCWGDGTAGVLGLGNQSTYNSPQLVPGGTQWKAVATSYHRTCALTTAGAAYCWGSNGANTLGDGTSVDPRTSPSPVTGGLTFTSISTDGGGNCGLTAGGVAYCWGFGDYGRTGLGSTATTTAPTAVLGGITFASVKIRTTTCGLSTSGMAYCWGYNGFGQVGINSTATAYVPTSLYDLSATAVVAASVDPSLTFAISAHAGTCNGIAQTAGTSVDATTVALGRLAGGSQSAAAQDVAVSTNAASGFTVLMRSTGQFMSGATPLAANAGSNASPATFASAGTEATGYTTSDATLTGGTANRFTSPSARWAPLSLTDVPVSSATATGTDTVCVMFQAGTSTTTAAGSYATTVIYTAVPTF